jgi:hypothetical protein
MCVQGFYDPVKEKMYEPAHTGISYSFTDDGYYEEAYYRAISNRKRSLPDILYLSNPLKLQIPAVPKEYCNGNTAPSRSSQTAH